MNINDLTKEQLNTLAALGQGWRIDGDWSFTMGRPIKVWAVSKCRMVPIDEYDPCNNGNQAMELVEKTKMDLSFCKGKSIPKEREWMGCVYTCKTTNCSGFADNPKLAIVRAFVASQYGTEIDYEKIVGGA